MGKLIKGRFPLTEPVVQHQDQTLASCHHCGDQWFVLVGRSNDPPGAEHGAVALAPDGMITGYAGIPHCLSCGTEWQE